MRLFEKILSSSLTFYHGSLQPTITLHDGPFYMTPDMLYALAYTIVTPKEYIGKLGNGFIYTMKLKKNLDIFNPMDEEDIELLAEEALKDNVFLTDKDINKIKTLDWTRWSKRIDNDNHELLLKCAPEIYLSKKHLINWIKNAGFDGFLNNEHWETIKYKREFYESFGTGICVFDSSNIEIIDKKLNSDFMTENQISLQMIFKKQK